MDIMHNNPANHDDSADTDARIMVPIPRMSGVNENLQRVTEQTRTVGRPANTSKAYDGKKNELVQYLDTIWDFDEYPRLLN